MYSHLLSEGRIGKLTLRNRAVLSPMVSGTANYDGTPSEQMIAYYEARAKDGAGLVITEATRVNNTHGASAPRQLSMVYDRHIEPFRKLADRLHAIDTKVFVQLHHAGREGIGMMSTMGPGIELAGRIFPPFYKLLPIAFGMMGKMLELSGLSMDDMMDMAGSFAFLGPAVVGPSNVPMKMIKQRTRALRKGEIKKLENQFIAAAKRVQKAGGDGVELHAAHGYLIEQFMSSYSNRRKDEYGGSLDNRMRFALNIIEGIRRECGPDFPIAVRLGVDEFLRMIGMPHQGIELEEGVEIARRLEKAGVDAIDVSSGTYDNTNYSIEPVSFPPGWRKFLAKAVSDAVSVPVIAANTIKTPAQADEQIAEGSQDFASMGRALLADPYFVKKAAEDRAGEITRCISCLRCTESLAAEGIIGQPIVCSLNPRLGRERETAEPKVDGRGRTVAIIGAGPGGLKAAEICAARGFHTVVFERSSSPGGQVRLAAAPPKKDKMAWCYEDFTAACERGGVEFRFNSEPGVDEIKALDPCAVIVATGAKPVVPKIPGIDRKNVCTADEVLDGTVKLNGKRVAVIGSGLTGLETAEKLGSDGNSLLIVEMLGKIGPGVFFQNLEDVMDNLKGFNPEFVTSYKLVEIGDGEITLEHVRTCWQLKEKVDAVVLAIGVCSENTLAGKLKPHFKNLYTIGDARNPGKIYNAVKGGFDTAWNL
ncbi:MAG: FAD-dependent oxidoreductase [Actinobacteria bacterium]|nr:FAD-dependent oxidoreductase [Actinomycetota bacterium]